MEYFYKFYYFIDHFEDIALSIDLLKKYNKFSDVTLEFTTKNEKDIPQLSQAVELIGFKFYAELVRFKSGVNKLLPEDDQNLYYQLATLDNKEQLLEIMHRDFDIFIDKIPTETELVTLINQKKIAIRSIDGKIIFIQIFEHAENALYLRLFWIDKEYRKPKYTVEIYKGVDNYIRQLNLNMTKNFRSYFWVNTKNKNYRINLKAGAQLDGAKCITYVSKKVTELTIHEN